MIRAVLDTNVIVSAALTPEGQAAVIVASAVAGRFRFYLSEEILAEYREVLARARFQFDEKVTAHLLNDLRNAAIIVMPKHRVKAASDPEDNRILECALEARADYVVTGNLRHFPRQFQDVRVISPGRFLMQLNSEL